MTARDEILEAIAAIVADRPEGVFTPEEVVTRMHQTGSSYAESTFGTHIVSRMFVNAPANHKARYPDLERVEGGHYRLMHVDQARPGTVTMCPVR